MDIVDCPHSCEPRSRIDGASLSRCQLLTDALGFVNSVLDEQCRDCLTGRDSPPADVRDTDLLLHLAKKHLRNRIHNHDDPRFAGWYTNATMSACVAKLLVFDMPKVTVGGMIVEAVLRGYAKDEALALVEEHRLE